jgi:uncharacterized membrane protein YraQ (UPF0718 family)
MIDILRRESIYLWYYCDVLFHQIFWYWAVGIAVGSAISVFGKAKIHSFLVMVNRKNLGLVGLIPAAIIGAASPLCMYGTIPVAASFSEKGVRDDWLAAFMMSSVLLNPQLILYSAALGKTMLVIRIASCLLCGILAGLLVHCFFSKKSFFNFRGFREPAGRDIHPNPVIRFLKNVCRNIRTTGVYFLAGIILSAVFQRYVPSDAFASLFGSDNRGFGVLSAYRCTCVEEEQSRFLWHGWTAGWAWALPPHL